jgi:phage-related protein
MPRYLTNPIFPSGGKEKSYGSIHLRAERRAVNTPPHLVEFYEDLGGASPLEEFLDRQGPGIRARFVKEAQLLQTFGFTLREPHVKHIAGKIWELRFRHNREAFRVFYFCPGGKKFVLLHIFVKKTEKTPRREIEIALSRMEDYLDRLA